MTESDPVLHYWEGRGVAESIRMILALAGVKWTHAEYLTRPEQLQYLRDNGFLLFQQVPLLQWEGKNMVQARVIVRHIGISLKLRNARKYGLDGKNEDEKYQVDMLTEGGQDFLGSFMGFAFKPEEDMLKNIREKALPRYMPVFEKILENSTSGFLVGDSVTMADIKLFEVLTHFPERCPDAFDGYPKIKEFYEKIRNLPRIKAYMEGPQRFGPNDQTYVNAARATLPQGW